MARRRVVRAKPRKKVVKGKRKVVKRKVVKRRKVKRRKQTGGEFGAGWRAFYGLSSLPRGSDKNTGPSIDGWKHMESPSTWKPRRSPAEQARYLKSAQRKDDQRYLDLVWG